MQDSQQLGYLNLKLNLRESVPLTLYVSEMNKNVTNAPKQLFSVERFLHPSTTQRGSSRGHDATDVWW